MTQDRVAVVVGAGDGLGSFELDVRPWVEKF
jgi:hypothetical protein